MSVIAKDTNFNFEYLQFLLELGAQQGVQNDRSHHIISGEWSLEWAQTFTFRDIRIFRFALKIPAVIAKNSNISKT